MYLKNSLYSRISYFLKRSLLRVPLQGFLKGNHLFLNVFLPLYTESYCEDAHAMIASAQKNGDKTLHITSFADDTDVDYEDAVLVAEMGVAHVDDFKPLADTWVGEKYDVKHDYSVLLVYYVDY